MLFKLRDMHIHFMAIGGAGIGPLALFAKEAGYDVSGSDKQDSNTLKYLKEKGITNIFVAKDEEVDVIKDFNSKKPIDWVVYSSAILLENPNSKMLEYFKSINVKTSKRDDFINHLIKDKNLQMLAIAGTHGKTTTTAMLVWLFKAFKLDINHLLPAKVSFAEMAEYSLKSPYLVYEADEFDRNFLNFYPKYSLISGVAYDHHEIYKTIEEYKEAFRQFIDQSERTFIYRNDYNFLNLNNSDLNVLEGNDKLLDKIKLKGLYNRQDALLVSKLFEKLTSFNANEILEKVSLFPGLYRRMEEIRPNLYSDYAHTPEKIIAALNVAKEMVQNTNKQIIVVYEPLTNRRQHFIKEQYRDTFNDADHIYWVDSYLAREDPNQHVLSPSELIRYLANPSIAEESHMNQELKAEIQKQIDAGNLVIALSGGGGNSLDEWIRSNFKN